MTKEASTVGAVTGFLHLENAPKSKSYEEEEIDKGPAINPKTPSYYWGENDKQYPSFQMTGVK